MLAHNWVKPLRGLLGAESVALDIVKDNAGNVYTYGTFVNTVDFDPSPNTYTLNSTGYAPYVTKFDALGNLIWAKHFANPFQINSGSGQTKIAVDNSGNVYCTGAFFDFNDFDPGPSSFTMNPVAGRAYLCKLDPNGNFSWAKQFGDTVSNATCVQVDNNGDVIISGHYGRINNDFDPGPSAYPLILSGQNDVFVCKVSSSGNLIWARSVGGTLDESVNDLSISNLGQLIFTGRFNSLAADFDPGATTFTLNSQNGSAFIMILSSAGSFVNAWQLGNSSSGGVRLHCDNSGNLTLLTKFSGVGDFDPGPATLSFSGVGSSNYSVGRYTSLGILIWAKHLGQNSIFRINDIVIDLNSNIFMGGSFNGPVDFDPGPGTYTLTTGILNNSNSYICRLNSNGDFVWVRQVEGSTYDNIAAITLNPAGDLYATGEFAGGASDFDIGPGIVTMNALDKDVFILKLSPCSTPSAPSISSTTLAACGSANFTLTASPTSSITWRTALMSNSYISYSSTLFSSLLPVGTYSFYAATTNTCGESFPPALVQVSVFPFPNISVTASKDTFCYGENVILTPSGGINYVMSNAFYTSTILVTPLTNTIYTIVGGDVNGCSSTTTISLTADLCTAISENEKANTIKVWPNPAKESINISGEDLRAVELFNSIGQLLHSQNLSNESSKIPLPYPAGIYYLKLIKNSGVCIEQKIIVE